MLNYTDEGVQVPLGGKRGVGRFALVSVEDAELVLARGWSVTPFDAVQASVGGKVTWLHHFIMGKPLAGVVDHINGNRLDNRRSNLRFATVAQNAHNGSSHTGASSRYKGVSWYAPQSNWRARICLYGKIRFIGYFASETEAARAYDKEATRLFGAFARLNFASEGV